MGRWRRWLIGATFSLLLAGGLTWVRAATETVPELSADLIACLKTSLGEDRFVEMMNAAQGGSSLALTEAERQAAEACVSQHQPGLISPSPSSSPSPSPTATSPSQDEFGLTPALKACLRAGIPNFDDLMERMRSGETIEPTPAMQQAAERCFSEHGSPAYSGPPPSASERDRAASSAASNQELMTCMEGIFGADRFSAMKRGQGQPTNEEMRRVKAECFDKYGDRFEAPADDGATGTSRREAMRAGRDQFGMSDEQKNCIVGIIGDERFRQMMKGLDMPSAEEKSKIGQACFGSASRDSGGVTVDPSQSSGATTYAPSDLPDYMKSCLAEVFGADAVERMSRGELQIGYQSTESQAIDQCIKNHFAASPPPETAPPSAPTGTSTAPNEECILSALGANYDPYRTGQYGPTQEEYARMKDCF